MHVKAGDEIVVAATVKNLGNEEITRVYGITQSDNPMFDKREFLFGHIAAGQSRTWELPIKVPKSLFARVDEVRLKLNGLTPKTSSGKAIVTVDELPRPHFACRYQIHDEAKGNGDGLLDPGEEVELGVSFKNIGKGAAQDTYASLKNNAGEAIYIDQGRAKLGVVQPGEEKQVTMHFSARTMKKVADVTLSVTDIALGEQLSEKLSFDFTNDKRSPSKVEPKRGFVRIKDDKAKVFAGASSQTDALAETKSGMVLKVTALVHQGDETFYRVAWDKGHSGFVLASAAELQADSKGKEVKHLDEAWTHTSPDIEISEGIRGTHTLTASIPLKGTASDSNAMRDLYIFVNDQKVFYQAAKEAGAGKDGIYRQSFETTLPLKVGTNTVTIIAREDEETSSQAKFVVLREGEAPVATSGETNTAKKN
jgi:carboxyl-terminal processing protease